MRPDIVIVQISDTHVSVPGAVLHGGLDPEAAFLAVLDRIEGLRPRPDFVFLSGDLTENGLPEEYANFRRLIGRLDLPAAAIPGNHDRRDAFLAGLEGSGLRIGSDVSALNLVVDDLPVRLIGLDSLGLEGVAAGELSKARLEWLERRLDEGGDRPTLLFLHHPPFQTGLGDVDRFLLTDPDRLEAIVRRYPNVLRVSAGHVHRTIDRPWAGTGAGVCPSVSWPMPILWPDAPGPLVPGAPGFQLHFWSAGVGLVTHTQFVFPEGSAS